MSADGSTPAPRAARPRRRRREQPPLFAPRLPGPMSAAGPPPLLPRAARRSRLPLGVGALLVGVLLGLWQPLLLVAVGGFGIAAGPSYVGLFFLLSIAVVLFAGALAAFVARSRAVLVPLVIVCGWLSVGMVGGNLLASSLHISFAASRPEPTPAPPTGPGWSATGSMLMARYDHSATLLLDGRVLVAGGASTGEAVTAAAELYDARTGTWTSTGTMMVPSSHHTAVLLDNGRVLVVSSVGQDTEIYDPATGAWTATGNMATPRRTYVATLLHDGRVLVTGGVSPATERQLASAELYDPATGTWSATAPMSVARAGHAAALLADGRVLTTGGGWGSPLLASAEIYDPITGTWTATARMHAGRTQHAAIRLRDGSILAVGGFAAAAEVYDPATGAWGIVGGAESEVSGPATILLDDGRVLVVHFMGSLEMYDPMLPTPWQHSGNSHHGNGATATLLTDGRVLLAGGSVFSPGGYGFSNVTLATAHLFDPS